MKIEAKALGYNVNFDKSRFNLQGENGFFKVNEADLQV